MIGIGTQEMARMHQDDLRRQAAVLRMAGRVPVRWRHAAGTALVRLGTRLSGTG